MPASLLNRLQQLDGVLEDTPNSETDALRDLVAERALLVGGLAGLPFSPADVPAVRALQERTLHLQARLGHLRRLLAAELGQTESHRRFLQAVEGTAANLPPAGIPLRG